MAANFGNYVKNRPGFQKEFRALSDKAWNDGINLIKKIAQRGGTHDFSQYKIKQDQKTLDLNEVESMAYALDLEKRFATEAHNIHHTYSFNHNNIGANGLEGKTHHYDPEVIRFKKNHRYTIFQMVNFNVYR